MTSLDITLDDFELEGWPFIPRLTRRANKVQEEGNCGPFLKALKEFNPSAYRNARRRIRGALWKTRKAKFKRYKNNLVDYLKEINYV